MSDSKENKKTNKNLIDNVYQVLEEVVDPELGIDIFNLGLINDVNLLEDHVVEIKMTLTTMACPFADQIQSDVEKAVASLPEVRTVTVQLVWYPAWTPERLSRYARIALGIH